MQTIQWVLWQLRNSDTFSSLRATHELQYMASLFSAWEPKMAHQTVPEWGKWITVVTMNILLKYTYTVNHWLCSSWNRKQYASYYEWSAGVFNFGLSSEWLHSDCIYAVRGFVTLCASWNIRQTIQSCWCPLYTYQTYRCGGQHPDRQC